MVLVSHHCNCLDDTYFQKDVFLIINNIVDMFFLFFIIIGIVFATILRIRKNFKKKEKSTRFLVLRCLPFIYLDEEFIKITNPFYHYRHSTL